VEQRVDVAWLVEHFGMEVLPVESTYLVRTYTSRTKAADGSAAGSAIIGLFARDPRSQSLFHAVECDEMWHFYGGDPFRLVLLYPDGTSDAVVLGPDLAAGHRVQHLVPAGVWQAGELVDGGEWALFGCTVTPEFTPDAFRGGHAAELLATHPDRRGDIARLSVPADQPHELPADSPARAVAEIPPGVS
jgi:predicted cupin superfamily sugar epimerase